MMLPDSPLSSPFPHKKIQAFVQRGLSAAEDDAALRKKYIDGGEFAAKNSKGKGKAAKKVAEPLYVSVAT